MISKLLTQVTSFIPPTLSKNSQIGFLLLGPLFVLFIEFIYDIAVSSTNKKSKIFFALREGELLQQLFMKINKLHFQNDLLHISRISLWSSTIQNSEDINIFLSKYLRCENLRIYKLLNLFDLPHEIIQNVNPNEILKTKHIETLKRLVYPSIIETSLQRRKYLLKYLEKVINDSHYYIIDIGYGGTCTYLLQKFLLSYEKWKSIILEGIFLISLNRGDDYTKGVSIKGFLSHFDNRQSVADLIISYDYFFESVCMGPLHKYSVKHYDSDGNPVTDQNDKIENEEILIQEYRHGISAFTEQWIEKKIHYNLNHSLRITEQDKEFLANYILQMIYKYHKMFPPLVSKYGTGETRGIGFVDRNREYRIYNIL